MIKNCIFDFDGTLMDTAPVVVATTQAAIKELGLPERSEEQIRDTIGLRLEDIPAKMFAGLHVDGREYASVYRRLFDVYNAPGLAKPFDGVIETIKDLHRKGILMAIATSRSHRSLEDFVEEMGLAGMFVMLVGGDDVVHGKPSPEPVLKILEAQGWHPEETLVVGDAPVDVLMGKDAGAIVCAVTYGNGKRADLIAAGADYIVDNFRDVERIVERHR